MLEYKVKYADYEAIDALMRDARAARGAMVAEGMLLCINAVVRAVRFVAGFAGRGAARHRRRAQA